MRRLLLRTVLFSTFGANATSPRLAALFKLSMSFVGASILGALTTELIRSMGISNDLPAQLVLALITLLGFVFTGIFLFSFGLSGVVELQNNSVLRVVSVFPISKLLFFVLRAMPGTVVMLASYIFLLPSVWYFSGLTNTSHAQAVGVLALGCVSCLGLIITPFFRNFFLKFSLYVLLVYGMGRSINHVIASGGNFSQLNYMYVLCAACILVAFCSVLFGNVYSSTDGHTAIRMRLPRFVIAHLWFGIKFLRNHKARTSVLFSFALIIITTYFLSKNPYSIVAEDWVKLSAFITMVVFCDARATVRKYKSLELHLNGVDWFVRQEVQSLRLLGLLMTIPLLIVVLANNQQSLPLVLLFSAMQSLASAIGILAGSLLAVSPSNSGGQLLAVIFGGGLLYVCMFLIGQYPWMLLQALGYILTAVIIEGVVRIVESKRQRRYGHA